jgi:type IV pilus assembly protein PilV
MSIFKKKWKSSRQAGFTIVEVLIAIVILGIGLAAIGMSIITSLRITNQSKLRSEALAFARLEMERIQTNAYNNIIVGTNFPINRAEYDGYFSVTENTNLFTKSLYLKIYWEDQNDPAASSTDRKSVELQSIMSEALHR